MTPKEVWPSSERCLRRAQYVELPTVLAPRGGREHTEHVVLVKFEAGDDACPEMDAPWVAGNGGRHGPKAGGIVEAAGEERIAARTERHDADTGAMRQRWTQRLARTGVPQSRRAIVAAGDDHASIGAERGGADVVLMSQGRADGLAGV